MNDVPSTAVAISSERKPRRLRTLEELDDEDAIAIGRVFARPSTAVALSVLGLGVAVVLGALAFGLSVEAGLAAGIALSTGVGVAGQRRTRAVMRMEIGVSDADADALYAATGAVRTVRFRRPRTDDELRAFGREIIGIALDRRKRSTFAPRR